MWERKTLKQDARGAFKANYWHCIIISFIVVALASSQGFSRMNELKGDVLAPDMAGGSNTAIVDTFLRGTLGESFDLPGWLNHAVGANDGAIATLFNQMTDSGSFLFGILNSANQLLFHDSIMPAIIILAGAAITFLFWLLFKNIIMVGQARFYMENRLYHRSRPTRLFFIYKIRRVGNAAKIMFLRALYLFLWSLTIVGGIIKFYAYRMVPYIVAENPDISARDAFRLSRQMMRGNKWKAFLLDLSFLGWGVLSILSFGLLYIFYVHPYVTATGAELYMALRGQALQRMDGTDKLLNDRLLATPPATPAPDEYPVALFPIPEHPGRHWISSDYKRRYSLTDYILLFFAFAMIGYVYEVGYYLFSTGAFINRGTMYGPWLPVYGCGGVITLLLLRRWSAKPLLTFFMSAGLCGVLEYSTAWALETFWHTKWWDYSGFFLNLQGRVCLEGLIVFGLGCCLSIYTISPSLSNLFDKAPKKLRTVVCIVLCAAFLCDLVLAAMHPNVAGGIPAGM